MPTKSSTASASTATDKSTATKAPAKPDDPSDEIPDAFKSREVEAVEDGGRGFYLDIAPLEERQVMGAKTESESRQGGG